MTQELQKQLEAILNSALSIFQVVATFLAAFFVVLWLTLCFWAFRDIQSRTRDIIAQIMATLLILFFNIPGVLLYMLVRPKETLNQAYERSLQEEYMLQDLEEREICATCRVKTQPDFLFCFNCRTRLRRECTSCNQLVKIKWASCPFCGSPQKAKIRETTTNTSLPRANTNPTPRVASQQTTSSALAASNPKTTATMIADPEETPTTSVSYHADGGATAPVNRYDPADLANDIAPELNPDATQPIQQQYQTSRQRRQKNNPNEEE